MPTHVRWHITIAFANPYLRCDECDAYVPSWHDGESCGCETGWWNEPCHHTSPIHSVCPSWSPADGCQCMRMLGKATHKII